MIVIQLSDPHIVAPGELLYGRVDTAEFLARSVAEINRLDPLPDVAVMTGDLVDHGNPAEYEHLRRLLAPLAMPIFVIPGNHDAREPLRAAFAAGRTQWTRLNTRGEPKRVLRGGGRSSGISSVASGCRRRQSVQARWC